MPSRPVDIGGDSETSSIASGTPAASASQSRTRQASTVRLSSPFPSQSHTPSRSALQSSPRLIQVDRSSELSTRSENSSVPRAGPSALSSALANSQQAATIPLLSANTPPRARELTLGDRVPNSNYGSIDARQQVSESVPIEDPEIIKRHLVQRDQNSVRFGSPRRAPQVDGLRTDEDEFSSLKLQGGDITREVYRWAEEAEGSLRGRYKRSQSFHVKRPEPENETLDISNIRQPGGFRRNYLRRLAGDSPAPSGDPSHRARLDPINGHPTKLFTNSFLEFLTLYGHFAGEDLEEDDEALEEDEYFSSDAENAWGHQEENEEEYGEGSALLTPGGKRRRKHKSKAPRGTNTSMNAALLLLKSFVGTGVLFLPRAFLNGGMLFSCLVLLGVAILSFYSFILLINTRSVVEASFGDMGGILYGKWMRSMILFSIVLSQIGFVSAYIVFTSENSQAFVLAVSKCRSFIDIKFMVMMQLVIFLPLSLVRDIGKLGFTALVADFFILLGLIYLYYYDIFTIVENHGVADVKLFNPSSWTLFIGTAIFTFEGIGLIIPIQESMKHPEKFARVLGTVMIIVTLMMISIGVLSYAAYGSSTKTVVILNLPQDSKFVNAIQFLYSIAILLSTPLQLFPAIRILETELFSRSGKYNPYIKWQKNVFRFFLVVFCALIAWGGAADLDKFVSLVGSFACVPLVWIYPPLLHLKAVAKGRLQRTGDYLLCGFGIVACAYTTVLTIQQWAGGHQAKAPGYCDS